MEIVVELKEKYDEYRVRFVRISNPNLTEFKSLVLELAGIYAVAVHTKTILLEVNSTLREANRGIIESDLQRWILKGYAQGERSQLSLLSAPAPLAVAIKELEIVNSIMDGCKTLFQVSNQILGIFQIEAKLSYVGHD
jgi:hypothetical protein